MAREVRRSPANWSLNLPDAEAARLIPRTLTTPAETVSLNPIRGSIRSIKNASIAMRYIGLPLEVALSHAIATANAIQDPVKRT